VLCRAVQLEDSGALKPALIAVDARALVGTSVFGATCVLSDYTGRIIFGAIASADLPGTLCRSAWNTSRQQDPYSIP
jgi:hypothetical protein